MAASASLTIPVTLATPAQEYDGQKILQSTAGTENIKIDAAGGKVTLGYQFPGNIDALAGRLRRAGILASSTIAISVPVENISGRTIDSATLLEHLNHSPAISGAAYDGQTVTATIVAATNAMRFLYEEIIISGLMPLDERTIAGPQEFVL
jgi:transcriptional regulator with GAF, ATPase, and Fis domain